MKITAKQANVLDNLHRIVMRRVGGRREPFLDGTPCKLQIHSLGAKGLVRFDEQGRPVRADKRVELLIVQYRRSGMGQARAEPQTSPAAEPAEGSAPPEPLSVF